MTTKKIDIKVNGVSIGKIVSFDAKNLPAVYCFKTKKLLSGCAIITHKKIEPPAEKKCECGGDTANTTHSTWCPKK